MKTVIWIFFLLGAGFFAFSLYRKSQDSQATEPLGMLRFGNATVPNLSGPSQNTLAFARPQGIKTEPSLWESGFIELNPQYNDNEPTFHIL